MKKMVITGANGFLGRNAKEYFEKRYEITGIDLAENYNGEKTQYHNISYYQCNMSQDSAEMATIFTSVQPDVIIHCAGSANVGASVINPMADLDGNLHSLYQLLLALKAFEKRPKIIFLSSAGVYGNPKSLPIHEYDELTPMSPYGLHKRMGEELCEYYNRIYDYKIRTIRIFSAYGNGLRKQLLWDIFQKYQNTGRIELFGTGNETRDFIHVSDIMKAMELILDYEGDEQIFNVANGEEVSIRKLAEIYAECLGVSKNIVSFNGKTKEGDPKNWRADISLLKKLGYEKSMELEKGIAAYVKWAMCE